ncbi:MAG: hypothetical protein CL424_10875 [Acidimicrobiaceae bacterium]|nr:hypothetical protein [Acidimicrobiaceae bacterium]
MSANTAAATVGVSAATMSAWLTGRTEPSHDDLMRLARLANLPEAYLLDLAGRTPASLSGSTRLLLIESAVRGALRDLDRWTGAAQRLVDQPAAAVLAGAILERCPDLIASLVPRYRGRARRVRAQTFVALARANGQTTTPSEISSARRRVEDAVGDVIDATAAVWRDEHQLDTQFDDPALVLMVLDQERSRGPSEAVAPDPRSIAVIGTPYAHAELAASVIADKLGFGLINPLDLAQRRFGLRRANDPHRVGQRRIVREILSGQLDSMQHVWTVADVEVVDEILEDIPAGPVVCVTGGPRLRSEGARMWGYTTDRVDELHDRICRWARARPATTLHEIDDAVFDRHNRIDRDRLFDDAWDVGAHAAAELLVDRG